MMRETASHKRWSANEIQTVDAVVAERTEDVGVAGEMTADQTLAEMIGDSRADAIIETVDQTFATWIPLVAVVTASEERAYVALAPALVATTNDARALHLVLTPTSRPAAALVALGAPLDAAHAHAHALVLAAALGAIVATALVAHVEASRLVVATHPPLPGLFRVH
jgi:hypothetical protein